MTSVDGDKIFTNYQYEFNGLLFGSQTQFIVEGMDGLRALPSIRTNNRQKPGAHGTFPGQSYYDERKISWDMWISAAAGEVDELVDQEIGSAFQLTGLEIPFVFRRPQLGRRRFYSKVTKFDMSTGFEMAQGLGSCSIEITGSDPFYYSNELHNETVDIPSPDSSGEVDVYNAGRTASRRFTITVRGPIAANSTIMNAQDASRQLQILDPLATGEYLVIDMFARSAVFFADFDAYTANDGEQSYNFTRTDSRWFSLMPGMNAIVLNRDPLSGTAMLSVDWRDAWII